MRLQEDHGVAGILKRVLYSNRRNAWIAGRIQAWSPQMKMPAWLLSGILYRKTGICCKASPQDEQDRDEWAVLKRYGCSNVHLVVQRNITLSENEKEKAKVCTAAQW